MSEVCAIEAMVDLTSRDPLDVVTTPSAERRDEPFLAELRPKSSFEVAWDLAH